MSRKAAVPDAWDDDWTVQADVSRVQPTQPEPEVKLSKAARRAQHVEQQKQLWDNAENPGRNMWLESQGIVPLKQEFKAPVTLLSRKPLPVIARRGTGGPSIDDDEDSEEEARKKREADFEDRQRKANIEREEKLRKYAEARQRIMGIGTTSSPSAVSRENSQGRDSRPRRSRPANNNNHSNYASQSASPANQSPIRSSTNESLLFDPDDMGRRLPRNVSSPIQLEGQPTRQPRGPDTSGRGGFGFANRGGKTPV